MADTTDEDKLEKLINKSNRMLEQLESEGFYEIDSRIKKAAGGLGVAAIGYDKKNRHSFRRTARKGHAVQADTRKSRRHAP